MQRIGRWTRLKPGREQEYREWHRKLWPELLALISKSGIKNYTIYAHGRDLYSYLEVDDWEAAIEFLANEPVARKWQELMAPLMDAFDPVAPWEMLEEVFRLD